jgi:hypothetical protein
MRGYAFALALVCLLAPGANAETLAETASKAGLLGMWSADCSKPPSKENWYVTYAAAPDGGVTLHYDRGPAGTEDAVMDYIEILGDGNVLIRTRRARLILGWFRGGTTEMVHHIEGDHKRQLQSAQSYGPTSRVPIKDGLWDSGEPTQLHERCSARAIPIS